MINRIIKDMDKKGETEREVGGVKIIRHRPSDIESINNIGRAIRSKERLEKEREIEGKKKANPVQWGNAMEKWEKIEKRHKDPVKEYLNLTQGK